MRTPLLQQLGRFTVVRDDLLAGGSKTRFLPFLIEHDEEVVFGGPFCGGAPVALAAVCKALGKRCTIFYAERKNLHRRQLQARGFGAELRWVHYGRMSHVQKQAREYAAAAGAHFLPLGFDVPEAEEPFVEVMRQLRRQIGDPEEVWCATASGMLTRCLGLAFPNSQVVGICVGLASRWEQQAFSANVKLIPAGFPFEHPVRIPVPFPACPNYERKAWYHCQKLSRGRVLFWNVIGN